MLFFDNLFMQVNLSFFTTDFWNNINLESTLAGSDPSWRSMLTTRWTDCYNKAQAIPTEALTRMSFMKSMPQLARNMEFWMCAMVSFRTSPFEFGKQGFSSPDLMSSVF